MPQKMRNKALCGSLTLKAQAEKLSGLQEFAVKAAKTKEAATTLTNM